MNRIEDIPEAIAEVLGEGNQHFLNVEDLSKASTNIMAHVKDRLEAEPRVRKWGTLRASELGKPCLRQLYLDLKNDPNIEPLPVSAKVKFLYGNILEEMVLALVRATGKYEVGGEQDVLKHTLSTGWEIVGHRDATINGHTVDVKSASSYSYKDYTTNGVTNANDKFGYRHQLSYYNVKGTPETKPYFLFIDKQLGHIKPVQIQPVDSIGRAENVSKILDVGIPDRMEPVPEGASGNMKLDTVCSYCSRKKHCFPEMRTFMYSKGPVFLTKVVKTPNVPEVQDGEQG